MALPLYNLRLQLFFENRAKAEIVQNAISPELNARHSRRSSTNVTIKNSTLLINISAEDATALRAAANACLRSIILSNSLMEE